ncbi:apoptosis regulator BAX-like isoform X1 [Pygocentrus nattereri]|uniref:apoptosis regulator BAX-like isoform X1 n=1 Tax=Pygocentrus nattereri TaxID=42514 RepID=UPI0008143C7D|nr:apoptosis regulator BAX-like isoform X1 [Pygocentrus nattereri]
MVAPFKVEREKTLAKLRLILASSSDLLSRLPVLFIVVEDQVRNVTTEVDTSSLGLPKSQPIANAQDQMLVEQLALTIRVIGDRLDQDQEFNDMINRLGRVADKSSFWKLVERVFSNDEINWGRIIVLFYSIGKLSAKMVLAHLPAVFTDIVALSLDYFRKKLLQWICNMGGWINSISGVTRFSIEQFSASSLSSIPPSAGLMLVFITGALLGGIIMWRLNRCN